VKSSGQGKWLHNLMQANIILFFEDDSVSWDLTTFIIAKALKKEKNDDIIKVECFDEMYRWSMDETKWWYIQYVPNQSYVSFCPDKVMKSYGTLNLAWVSPFFMAFVNGDVVKRSISLRASGNFAVTNWEWMLLSDFKTAFAVCVGHCIVFTALLNPISESFLRKFVLLKPGQGPSKKVTEKGYLCVHGAGAGSKGNMAESAMYFLFDVGCHETAWCLVASGLCLALDRGKLPVQLVGFYTPFTGMGNALLDRLSQTGTLFHCRVLSSTVQSNF
jgi:hypothetical protein